MYNKEALRKELEDAWDECSKEVFAQVNRGNWKESGLVAARDTYITSALSAMGEGEGVDVVKTKEEILRGTIDPVCKSLDTRPVKPTEPQMDLIPEHHQRDLKRLAKLTGHSFESLVAGYWYRFGEVQTLQIELEWRDKMIETLKLVDDGQEGKGLAYAQVEMMLSEFICLHAPQHSQIESPKMFINNWIGKNLALPVADGEGEKVDALHGDWKELSLFGYKFKYKEVEGVDGIYFISKPEGQPAQGKELKIKKLKL